MTEFKITTEIVIEVPKSRVWSALTNVSEYNNWNEFITNIEGRVELGGTLKLCIQPAGKPSQMYKVKIIELIEESIFAWLGHFKIPGLIDGAHFFELFALSDEKTKLVHHERFHGLLTPFVWNYFILKRLAPGFHEFNSGLKMYLEKK